MKNRIGKSKTKREKPKRTKRNPFTPKKQNPIHQFAPPFSDQSGRICLLQLPPSKSPAVKLAIADKATNTAVGTYREQPYCSRDWWVSEKLVAF